MSPNTETGTTAPARPATVPDVLDAAADILVEHGRCTGTFRDYDDRCCVDGALKWAASNQNAWDALNAARSAVQDALPVDPDAETDDEQMSIWAWNDDPDTTDDEVITTLRRVATEQRNAQNGGA